MTYEARPNGTRALTCDTGVCNGELLAHDDPTLFEDANLGGWIEDQGKHACPNCTRGANQMKALTAMVFGETPTMEAPADVRAGDPVFDSNGRQVATYRADAKAGQSVQLELYMPVKAVVQVSERYAEILGRGTPPASPGVASPAQSDELFDVFGESPSELPPDQPSTAPVRPQAAAPAPTRVKPQAPSRPAGKGHPGRPRTLEAPAGTFGGSGIVAQPPRPDAQAIAKAAQVAKSTQAKRNNVSPSLIEKLDDTASMFGFLDGGGWTPDDK